MAPTTAVWLTFLSCAFAVFVGATVGEQIATRDRLCALEGGKVEQRALRYISWNACHKQQ